ncbi:rhamnose utilization protein RhaD (predicted bifunctional aldolase and dehydrogenase) [Kribbella aluminosa]|uniref:Rhamnose utilization protein RhaD (Predicted bifunctional aldolase and dehydrogenase) n=1 Tax=Kribbella aluminosa TaxID=416017 RepID=A0ABS4UIY5_9ACTN|nr:class II aldolase/adducin family protein [Kribbella aluminosa]MBP2351620.1 rhamnose utilization protein RhaD (predicted bifunctional aldolase and dehydrogenase) [Kribbella aluminosa]
MNQTPTDAHPQPETALFDAVATEPLPAELVAELASLARWMGDGNRELAVLGEGNVSARTGAHRMLVKASGTSLEHATFVEVRLQPLLELLDAPDADDTDVQRALLDSRLDPTAPQPSVESLLHAAALTHGANVVAHCHPQSVNAIGCSDRAQALVGGALFPDQIVVLGREQILLPYVDPGLELGRRARTAILEFLDRRDERPRVIYLGNHGMVALAESCGEARRITQMADKTARILRDCLAVGSPRYLPDHLADRIHTRPDEALRRQALAAAPYPDADQAQVVPDRQDATKPGAIRRDVGRLSDGP